MKNNCCGCGCSGCLFWMVILGALVLGSCTAGRAQIVAAKLKNDVKPQQKTEQRYDFSKPANYPRPARSR